jgi:hypothetical protein
VTDHWSNKRRAAAKKSTVTGFAKKEGVAKKAPIKRVAKKAVAKKAPTKAAGKKAVVVKK